MTTDRPVSWDPIRWLEDFRRAKKSGRGLKRLRQRVFKGTARAVQACDYSVNGRTVDLDDEGQFLTLHRGTVNYRRTDHLVLPMSRRGTYQSTLVSVIHADCLEVARMLLELGHRPLVLNMASHRNPGGGVVRGAGAQEENLFRRTNLLYSLYQFVDYAPEYGVPLHPEERYPIGRVSGAIYSPRATVFRSSEATGYAFLSRPFQVSFVTVPAVSHPETVSRDGRLWLSEAAASANRKKIRAILRVAAHHGHDCIVLSAFGCGAFRNPPHHMAQLFADTFNELEFARVFRVLCFAILDDHNTWREHNPEGNLYPFLSLFEDQGVR